MANTKPMKRQRPRYKLLNRSKTIRMAYHIFTPALQYNLGDGSLDLPEMAVRTSEDGYQSMMLFDRLNILGPSQVERRYHNPLPGTAGRGVAVCFTKSVIQGFYRGPRPIVMDCRHGYDPKRILDEIEFLCKRLGFYARKDKFALSY